MRREIASPDKSGSQSIMAIEIATTEDENRDPTQKFWWYSPCRHACESRHPGEGGLDSRIRGNDMGEAPISSINGPFSE